MLARKALQESELRLTTLAAMVPEILYTATPDGVTDYVSRRFADYSGQPVEELQGHGWTNIVHPDDRHSAVSVWMNSVQSGTDDEVTFRLRKGGRCLTSPLATRSPPTPI